jgi:hypothetical protein
VQYEGFDFRVMRTEHFDVHYYPAFRGAATDAARMLERWYGRLSGIFQYEFDLNPIVLYANHPDFQQTNVIGGDLNEGTGGVTESIRTRVVLPLTGIYHDNDHVLGHELVHVFQYELAQEPSGGGIGGLSRLPLWVVEGQAEYLSTGRSDAHTAMWLRDAVIRDDLPTIAQLSTDPRYFPYRYGQAVWAYIAGRWGDERAISLFKRATAAGSFEGQVLEMFGMRTDSLSKDWHEAVKAHINPLLVGRVDPSAAGRPLIVEKERGPLNVSPVISPDGKTVAFFSQRGLFSVDLFLADAESGKILKTLASPTRGDHFDNLSFISSAGAWSPDSRKFAFIVFANGDNEIHILDVRSGNIERKIRTEPLAGAVSAVSWSPDGRRLAFSGISTAGIGDLFIVNADGTGLARLTNDRFAAIHPAWSPDGSQVAFATDQSPGANLDILAPGSMRIALLDVATSRVTLVPGFDNAKNINPQFSPDGRTLYFISDVGGFSDIFRLDIASGAMRRVTNVKTGISGITWLSPALSVAQSTGRLVFSVFSSSGTNIYSLESDQAAGMALDAVSVSASGALLPVVRSGVVEGYLADNTTFLPAATSYPERDYRGGISLEQIGAPTIGFTSSDYGSGFTGSISAYFGDMLGNRRLGVALAAQGDIKDYGAQAFYLNASRRLNWAAVGGRSPYITGFTSVSDIDPSPGTVWQIDQTIQRTYFDQASVLVQYPLSGTRRLEFDAGFTHISYDSEILRYFDYGTFIEGPERVDVPSPGAFSFVQGSAALVGDNSFFGYTAPIAGSRYRLEVSPYFGSITMQTLLLDGRKYFFARPFTFALRGLHYGRFGSDAEDTRLNPLYVGNDQFVRGYNVYSFSASDCSTGGSSGSCPEIDRLQGTRLAVANAELRIPLLGARSYALIPSSFLPMDLAAFFDAGAAWTESASVEWRFDRGTTDRVPVFSTGLSLRTNLMGLAVLEVFYARPFQRPSRSSVWGIQFVPGW